MDVVRVPIRSHRDQADERTYMELSVDTSARLSIGVANAGGEVLPTQDTQHDLAALIAACRKTTPQRVPGHPIIAVMQTLEGDVIADWECDIHGAYLAHLGFYNVETDELRLLQFVSE